MIPRNPLQSLAMHAAHIRESVMFHHHGGPEVADLTDLERPEQQKVESPLGFLKECILVILKSP